MTDCYELPVVVVSAVDTSFPDPTCNQLRYPAEDCLKAKVSVRVEVIDHADGSLNCYGDAPTSVLEATSNYRGQTSLFFPKHQLNVKFKSPTPFLGMPADKAFVLNGPFLDCSLLRNHLAHWLYRGTGRYSPRTKHAALYFRPSNDATKAPQYAGVYLLLEKLTYGPNRVGLATLDTQCSTDEELGGGWAWQNDPLSFHSYSPNVVLDQYQNEFGMGERPILAHPPGEALSQKMRDYFVDTSTGFLPQLYRALWDNLTTEGVLEQHIDLGSYADYLLHTEMSLNVDAYRRSTFFFKDREQPINAGPVWDLNLAYGNGARKNFKDWIFPQYTYWKRLMCNYKLAGLVIQRWIALRASVWSDEAIAEFLDESAAPMHRQLAKCRAQGGDWRGDVQQCLSVSLINCNGTYAEQVEALKTAVIDRARWMDAHITQLYKPLDAATCSGVGTIPKFNCALDGDDDGCLADPAKYYSALDFPEVRKPFSGMSCKDKAGGDADFALSPYEQPSVDDCWRSAGLYVYPQQKGVRDKTLTFFCSGYGSCPQGPGATCTCKPGVDVEPKTCRRIDAEMAQDEEGVALSAVVKVKHSEEEDENLSAVATEAKHETVMGLWMQTATCGALVVALTAAVALTVHVMRSRRRRERLNEFQPVRYGSIEDYNTFLHSSMR